MLGNAHQQLVLPVCNLYSNTMPQEAMRRRFKARDSLGNQPPLPAIFPDMEAPIVRLGDDGEPELVPARWGWNKARFGWVTNVRNLSGWPRPHVFTGNRCTTASPPPPIPPLLQALRDAREALY